MAESFSGTLTPNVVTTVTLSGVAENVTVRADGTDSIWFTTDGSTPTANNRRLPRAARGEVTVDVTSETDPTVVKLISPGAVAYRVSAATGGAQSGATALADHVYVASGCSDSLCSGCDATIPILTAAQLPAGVQSSQMTISFGPVVIAPGGTISDVQIRSRVDVDIAYIEWNIGNAAGTERVQMYLSDTLSLPAGFDAAITNAQWGGIQGQVGTDITLGVNGGAVSAAGGVFWVEIIVQVAAIT